MLGNCAMSPFFVTSEKVFGNLGLTGFCACAGPEAASSHKILADLQFSGKIGGCGPVLLANLLLSFETSAPARPNGPDEHKVLRQSCACWPLAVLILQKHIIS